MLPEISARVQKFRAGSGRPPKVALIRVGDDPASTIYLKTKMNRAHKIGIDSELFAYPEAVAEEEVVARIQHLNQEPSVDGILVQLPLPDPLSEKSILDKIVPEKDVDGLTTVTQGRLFRGDACLAPCTAQGIVRLLKTAHVNMAGKHAVIVGRSLIVGRPLAMMLLHENCTVTVAHSQSRNVATLCRGADILISSVGSPGFVTPEFVKEGATVIDVGISRSCSPDGTKCVVGDVDFRAVAPLCEFITPVPGGVGPMTVECLMQNVVEAAEHLWNGGSASE
jgi:methylenetetrahydrofolate dehydrogenase (NADP+)/methenyltetrahydrofolate cyclohydrolase